MAVVHNLTSLNCAKISRQKSSFSQVPPRCSCRPKFVRNLYACGARTITEEANTKHVARLCFGKSLSCFFSLLFLPLSVRVVLCLCAAVLSICGNPQAINSSYGDGRQHPLDSRRRFLARPTVNQVYTQQVRHSSSLSVQFEYQQPSSARVWKGTLSSRAR